MANARNPSGLIRPSPFPLYRAMLAKAGLECWQWRNLTAKEKADVVRSVTPRPTAFERQPTVEQYIGAIDLLCRDVADTAADGPYTKASGAIPTADRRRMINSLSLDEMDSYSLLGPAERSAYEDAWLRTHPVSPGSSVPGIVMLVPLLAVVGLVVVLGGKTRNNPTRRRSRRSR